MGAGTLAFMIWTAIPSTEFSKKFLKPGDYKYTNPQGEITNLRIRTDSLSSLSFQDDKNLLVGAYNKIRTENPFLDFIISGTHFISKGYLGSDMIYLSSSDESNKEEFVPYKRGCDENCKNLKRELEEKLFELNKEYKKAKLENFSNPNFQFNTNKYM